MELNQEFSIVRNCESEIRGLRSATDQQHNNVIALHGWLDNAASFIPLATHLRSMDIVAIDLPGHGRSQHLPAGMPYTFESAVHAVLDVADKLHWTTFSLIGHSMGAVIASFIAAACPERVQRMVCIEALGGLPESADNTAQRMHQSVSAMRELANRPLRTYPAIEQAIAIRMQVNQMSEPVARLIVERGIKQVADGFLWSSDPRLTVPTFARPTNAQLLNVIGSIQCPTHVVLAEPAQVYFPEETRKRYVQALQKGSLTQLPGTHHLHMEDPAPVAAAIQNFFDTH